MMSKRAVIMFILFYLLAAICLSQENKDSSLLKATVARYGQARIKIPFPGTKALNGLSAKVSVSSVNNKIVEIVLSPLTVNWFISQNYDYEVLAQPDFKSISTSSSLSQAMEWGSYPTYLQYDSIMQRFSSLYPSLCHLDTIGTSINGKLVLALKISDDAGTDEDEPEVFYTSTIHGDETGGFVLMLRLADYLLKNYNTDSRVRNLVDNLEIWINPLANPDGTYWSGNTISSPVRYNANGYDLNRNFPDPETPDIIMQKETTDMIKFMRAHHFVISANFHAGDEVVNYPWDRWSRLHADNDWFYDVSRKYADTVHLHSAPGYMTGFNNGVTNGYSWYKINGGRQDFMTWELHGREVTIELDGYFVTPAANLDALWQYNRSSFLGYFENALYGVHGSVTDAVTGAPVPARIFIDFHDKDSSQVYSDTLTGSFVRFLAPGTWDLTFSAKGYMAKTRTGVSVSEGQKTDISVKLVPVMNPIDTVPTDKLILYPNPAIDYLRVILPGWQTGRVNVMIYNSLGKKNSEYFEDTYEGVPMIINVNRLAPGSYVIVITNQLSEVAIKGRFIVVRP